VLALVVLCLLNVSFWGVYEQQGNTLALWADANSDRHLLAFLGVGWEMPATWFQSVNSVFIAAFTPFINVLWARQARAGREPSSVAKMAIGCIVLGLSFFFMMLPARVVDAGQLASMWWLIASTAILTVGELYLSPVGLSLVTKISPPRIVSMMMGFWYLSSFFGNYLSGYLGTYWETMTKGAFFLMLAAISLTTGLLMLALYAPLKRAIGDENAVAQHPPAADEPAA
jgi:POT family proton-dependent oligopeptide transporter